MTDPLLAGALDRSRGWFGRTGFEEADMAIADRGRWFCENAMASLADPPRPILRERYQPPAPQRRAAAYQSPSLDEILDRGLTAVHEMTETMVTATGFGAYADQLPADSRDTWLTAIPPLIAAGAAAGDLAAVAALVRASLFLGGPPVPLVCRAARMVAARQYPDGHFGSLPVTANCVWALAESLVPGLTLTYPAHEPLAGVALRTT